MDDYEDAIARARVSKPVHSLYCHDRDSYINSLKASVAASRERVNNLTVDKIESDFDGPKIKFETEYLNVICERIIRNLRFFPWSPDNAVEALKCLFEIERALEETFETA